MINWIGNFGQLFDAEGWDFHSEIVKEYGGAIKVYGLLGVCRAYSFRWDKAELRHFIGRTALYI